MTALVWITSAAASLIVHGAAILAVATMVERSEINVPVAINIASETLNYESAVAAEVAETTALQPAVAETEAEIGGSESAAAPLAEADTAETAYIAEDAGIDKSEVSETAAPVVESAPVIQQDAATAADSVAADQPDHVSADPASPNVEAESVIAANEPAAAVSDESQSADLVTKSVVSPPDPTMETAEATPSAVSLTTDAAATPDSVITSVETNTAISKNDTASNVAATADIANASSQSPDAGQAAQVNETVDQATPIEESPPQETSVAMITLHKPKPVEQAPKPEDLRVGMRAFLQSRVGEQCFLVRPKQIEPRSAIIDGIGLSPETFKSFETAFTKATGAALAMNKIFIADGQCPAIELTNALSVSQDVTLDLAQSELPDGAKLDAIIRGVKLPWLSVVIIDDEGMIADASSFVTVGKNGLLLHAPVRLQGGGSGSIQLLMVVTSALELKFMTFEGRRPAKDVLPLVLGEIRRKKIVASTAIVAFTVR